MGVSRNVDEMALFKLIISRRVFGICAAVPPAVGACETHSGIPPELKACIECSS
jgi:hypothetical protein